MSSRDYIRHVVLANTSLNGQRLGDEVYNPTTNKLYKTVPFGGTQVINSEVLLNGPAGVGVTGNIYVGSTNAGANGIYTDVLRYAANGLPWVMGSGGGGGATLSAVAAATTYYIGLSAGSSGSWTDARVDTANLFYTTANGTLFVTNYNTSSDRNLKDDIITITDGLTTVDKLRGVSFKWKNSGEKSYGIIAQELEEILPDLVSSAGGHKSVNYNALIGFLIEAVKELSDRVDELEKK